jgi:hypothetical protein
MLFWGYFSTLEIETLLKNKIENYTSSYLFCFANPIKNLGGKGQ